MKSGITKNSTATTKNSAAATASKPTTNTWKLGSIFAKNNNTTSKKEDTDKNSRTDNKKILPWTEKIKGLSANDKAKVLETELKTLEEELKEKNVTIKCLQEFRSGVGLNSSVTDFNKVKDTECRQLIVDMQSLYRELEDFNQTVNFDDNSKYEPPVAPVAKLMTASNRSINGEPAIPRHYLRTNSNTSKASGSNAGGNSKLSNIRSNWADHNLMIVDLNKRLKASYDYIRELEDKARTHETKNVEAPISAGYVLRNEKAPSKEEKYEPALWHAAKGRGVNEQQKNVLLSLAGGAGSDSEEDSYKAFPAKSSYEPPAKAVNEPVSTMMMAQVYANTSDNGQKPDWLDEAGEIHIKPVQATFINSIHSKAEKMAASNTDNSAKSSTYEPRVNYSAAELRSQLSSRISSQYPPVTKSKLNESDLSDADDMGKNSTSGYKAFNWSNYRPQPSYATSPVDGSQTQNKSGTTGSSYHSEHVTSNNKTENHVTIQPRTARVGNPRQAFNRSDSDVD